PFATRQHVQYDQRPLRRESESREDPVDVGLGPIPVCFSECELGIREAANRPIIGVFFHLAPQHLEPLLLNIETPSGKDVRHHGVVRPCSLGTRILRQEPQGPRHLHVPTRRTAVAGDRPQKRGLARAVSPHETDLVTRIDRKRSIVDEDAPTDLDRQLLGSQHGARPYRPAPNRLLLIPRIKRAPIPAALTSSSSRRPPGLPTPYRRKTTASASIAHVRSDGRRGSQPRVGVEGRPSRFQHDLWRPRTTTEVPQRAARRPSSHDVRAPRYGAPPT